MPELRFQANGLDAESGGYLLPELGTADLARVARGEDLNPDDLEAMRQRSEDAERTFGVHDDPEDLAAALTSYRT